MILGSGGERWAIHHGEALDVLPTLKGESFDALVTDPPAGIGFMGKGWDSPSEYPLAPPGSEAVVRAVEDRTRFVAYLARIFRECRAVLKPGAHAVVWSIPRTSGSTATALEDAGFEIRDVVTHLFGSGFPKSLDVSKAIDRARDDEPCVREICRFVRKAMEKAGLSSRAIAAEFGFHSRMVDHWAARDTDSQPTLPTNDQWERLKELLGGAPPEIDAEVRRLNERKGEPDEAWEERESTGVAGDRGGFGGKRLGYSGNPRKDVPASDDAEKWAGWGTSLKPASELWIIARKPFRGTVAANVLAHGTGALNVEASRVPVEGEDARWPPNVVLSHAEECGELCAPGCAVSELGEAARFFRRFRYVPKPSAVERNAGLEGLEPGAVVRSNAAKASADRGETVERSETSSGFNATYQAENFHPTVKPVELMRWLVGLVTPPGGTVLDPFAGSGSTGVAALRDGFRFVGIERVEAFAAIAIRRIEEDMPLFNRG